MSFKCRVCERTFSQRAAYSQHSQKCIKKVEVEEDDDIKMNIEDDQDSDYENNDIEIVIVLF